MNKKGERVKGPFKLERVEGKNPTRLQPPPHIYHSSPQYWQGMYETTAFQGGLKKHPLSASRCFFTFLSHFLSLTPPQPERER